MEDNLQIELQNKWDGHVEYDKWTELDGTVIENFSVVMPNYEIQVVRADHDNENILIGVNGWTTMCPPNEVVGRLLERLDTYP